MNFWGICFSVTFFLILYPLLIYPLILITLSVFLKRSIKADINFKPKISIVASFYNEEENILELFESIINSGYPLDNVEILFGSDGSSDQTNTILKKIGSRFNFVKTYLFERQGKTSVINKLIKNTTTPFVLLIDADVRFTKGAIDSLVSYFADPKVGIVSPYFIGDNQKIISLVDLNNFIRKYESEIFSTVNLLGACYMIRRELLPEIPSQKFCDDFFVSLYVNFLGKRVVLADGSFVVLKQKISPLKSFFRQRRFIAGGISSLIFFRKLFFKNFLTTFFLFSGKVLRWFIPINLIISWLCLLSFNSEVVVKISLTVLIIFVIIFLIDFYFETKGKQVPKIVSLFAKVFFSLSGSLVGFFRSRTDKNNSLW